MIRSGDTIAAVATPMGRGGVGIVRLSGPNSAAILSEITGVAEERLRDRYLEYGRVRDGEEILDDVLFVVMRGPQSFTGEDVAEIHGHGGEANMGRILRRVLGAGARHADPGEFTRRAFENGQLDLTQAEAIADVIHASSERALRVAHSQLRGSLQDEIQGIVDEVIGVLAEVEAGIDFPEDDLADMERAKQSKEAEGLAERCRALAGTFGSGRALQEGIDVAISGPVNAGKSSLFNALLGRDRAIVSPEAGTTRDYVEAQTLWSGVPVTLIDTAGERATENQIEDQGIEMGRQRAQDADVELVVREGSESAEAGPRQILVRSKCDGHEEVGDGIATSAHTGRGLDELRTEILKIATGSHAEVADGLVITNERQRVRLEGGAAHLSAAANLLRDAAPAEVVVIELNEARLRLAEITGAEVGDEMLDELFARFCIGK